jgi:hypothetical protein
MQARTPSPRRSQPTDADEREIKRAQRLIRGLSTTAIVVAAITGALGVGYAAIAWTFDELITARGWIVVGCTTTCALGIFLGAVGLQRARDREIQAAADRQRHQDAERVSAAVRRIEELLPSADVAARLEQLHFQVALVARRSQTRTRIMRQMLERQQVVEKLIKEQVPAIVSNFDGQIATNRTRLDSIAVKLDEMPRLMERATTHGVGEVVERINDLERDFAGMRVREAERAGDVTRIRQRQEHDR